MALFVYLGFCYLKGKEHNKHLKALAIASLIVIIAIQALAFDPALSMNGDNSRYICGAISLAETGQYKSIQYPQEIFITLDQPGMSIMLAPLVKIFGVNVVLFKSLTFLFTIAMFLLFFYLFKKYLKTELVLLLLLLMGTNPFVSDFSSLVMTEMPFVFFSLLSIWLLRKYEQSDKINYLFLVLSSLSILMTYFTRSIGISMAIASILYFCIKKDWKKAIFLGVMLFLLFGSWQLRCMILGSGKTQISAFTGENGLGFMISNGFKNLLISFKTIPQVLFAHGTTRFKMEPFDLKGFIVIAIIGTGLVVNMIKKINLYDLFFVFSLIVLAIGTPDTNPLPMARYLCVFIPFFLIYFYFGCDFLLSLWPKFKPHRKIIIIPLLLLVLFSNFSGTAYQIQLSHRGYMYPKPIENYIEAGAWVKKNTPDDAVVACRKENTFYLFSYRKGYQFASYWTKYDKKYEEYRMKQFERHNVSYLIIDTFSNSSQTAYKIIQNNPDKFNMIKIVGDHNMGACYIFKINKWWL